ncbi:hypothetical protein FRC18_000516 [Serendipita sp. 400]|nr:hypothetical protein FRC18_000516 [Serendipita sp. 400]
MSTKTIAVLNESELADGQMKEVAFGEGKVLVARLGEKVVSTSAYCTHYGAPLAKGVLTADGRITCPWHGACFNACTGDIEDAPALFGIHSFQTSVEDGQICVTADPKYTKKDDNLVRQPGFAAADFNKEESSGVVIVGGGSGAMHAIESLRDNGYKDSITVLSKEDYPPIDRTKLSKSLATQVSKVQLHSAEELRDKYGVDLRTGVTVTSVNTASMTVQAQPQGGSEETIPYTNLILAPGSFPRRLPIPNANLSNVYTLRFLEDSQKIDAACQKDLRVVIIGTSFISMELATTIAKRGMKSVDMVGMENTPFEMIMGKEVGEGLRTVMGQNINFHMDASVDSIRASSSDPSVADAVVLKDGTTLEADVIILGVGVAPATEFLKNGSGIQLEKDGGVVVDEYLKVPGVENVYAIGDIAVFPQTEMKTPRRIEHWNVAGNHGRAVGRTITGKGEPFSKIPIFWSVQGLRYCGLGGKANYDEIFINGNPKEGKFVAYYFKENKVVALASMGRDPIMSKSSELMRLGIMPTAQEIKDGADVLQVDVSSVQALQRIAALKQ